MLPNGITVSIIRRTASDADAYGNATYTQDEPVEVPGCAWAPREGSELTGAGRDGVMIDGTVYMPAGTDVRFDDLLDFGGSRYEVDGRPADWTSPYSGIARGIAVQVRRVEG